MAKCGQLLSPHISQRAAIITHPEVRDLYGPIVQLSLQSAGISSVFIDIPAGESYKQWHTIEGILPILRREGFDRGSAIGSLGGGVVGDLAGFLASIYMRGVPLFHLPTTLLAQVDSSLGGKTALNRPEGKNLLGTFYQPRAIIADTQTLATLPAREWGAGWAEAVKTALLAGPDLLALLEGEVHMADVVSGCLKFKAGVVSQDEGDRGLRQQLNLGHTFAHAFEAAGNYELYNHGEAVALGLLCALRLSIMKLGLCASWEEKTRALLSKHALPTHSKLSYEQIAPFFKSDKKAQAGKPRFIALHDVGRFAILDNVTEGDIRAAMMAVR